LRIDNYHIDVDAGVGIDNEQLAVIGAVVLHQNQPNPFNPSTRIRFSLPEAYNVDLTIYSVDGCVINRLVSKLLPAGDHTAYWQGRDERGQAVASGTYFYRLTAGGYTETRLMVLVR
jgi:flagellar hook assembly protein FlgD